MQILIFESITQHANIPHNNKIQFTSFKVPKHTASSEIEMPDTHAYTSTYPHNTNIAHKQTHACTHTVTHTNTR